MVGTSYGPMVAAAFEREQLRRETDPEDQQGSISSQATAAAAQGLLPGTRRRAMIGLGCVAAVGALAAVLMPSGRPLVAPLQGPAERRSFVVKAEGAGEAENELLTKDVWIKWKQDKDKCLNVAGGLATNGNEAQLGECDKKDENMRLSVSKDPAGMIQWAAKKEKCLNGADGELLWWDCDEQRKDQQLFEMPDGKQGVIRMAGDPDTCIVADSDDDFVGLGDCDSDGAQFVVEDCPAACEYSAWSKWSECSDMCGGGVSSRSRKVIQEAEDGEDCLAGRFQTRRCNAQKCQPAAAA